MSRTKRIASIAGMLLMAASLVFIARRLLEQDMDFSVLTSPRVIAGLAALAAASGLMMCASAINYRAWLRDITGIAVSPAHALKFYNASNLYKYIPGGVFFVLGRHRLAVEYEGLKHSPVLFATGLEALITVLAAIAVILLGASEHLAEALTQIETPTAAIAIIAALLIIALPIIFLLRKRIAKHFKKLTAGIKALKARKLLKRAAFALLMVFLWGAVFTAVLAILGQPLTPSLTLTIIGLYLVAWLAGAAIIGVPGGLGVREAALLFIMGGTVCASVLLSAIIVHRVMVVIGDVLGYCMAVLYSKICSPSCKNRGKLI